MTIIGGTPISISFGGDEYTFTGDAAPTIEDGFEVTLEMNGNKTVRKLLAASPWMANGCKVEGDVDLFEELKSHLNSTTDEDCTIEFIDGNIYQGIGWPVGRPSYDPSTASITFDAGGGGQLKKL